MRRIRSGGHAIVIALAFALAGATAAAGETSRLELVWIDPAALARGAYPILAEESARALRDLDAQVEWREAEEGALLGPEALAVIAVPTILTVDGVARHVMGATRPQADTAPAVWVYPDQVAWALGLALRERSTWGPSEQALFARALARVASHEVIHALGSPGHARSGLMSATLNKAALTAPSLALDGATAARVRRRLVAAILAARPRWPAATRADLAPMAAVLDASRAPRDRMCAVLACAGTTCRRLIAAP